MEHIESGGTHDLSEPRAPGLAKVHVGAPRRIRPRKSRRVRHPRAVELDNGSSVRKKNGMNRGGRFVIPTRPSTTLRISRRGVLPVVWGVCIAGWGLRSVVAPEAAQIRIQLDQQALNTVPGDERASLEVTEDTSPEAQALKARSPAGKAIPIIYLIAGLLSIPSIWSAVQEMLRRREYGGVIIDTRTTPANIHHDQSVQGNLVLVIRPDGSTESVHSELATEDFLKGVLGHPGG